MDEDYAEGNKTIAVIQADMVEYFKARNTELANKGLYALSASLAGIYYLPFQVGPGAWSDKMPSHMKDPLLVALLMFFALQSGMSLHFRFSGQSIPNRSVVKNEKGVKIYFDAVSTASRLAATKALVEKVKPGLFLERGVRRSTGNSPYPVVIFVCSTMAAPSLSLSPPGIVLDGGCALG